MKNSKKKIIITFLTVLVIAFVYAFRIESIGWYYWHNAQANIDPHALNLKNYRVSTEALPIQGLQNASELTYNSNTNTLFTVLNQENKIVELSLQGEIIRQVEVVGVDDMEGITYIDGNRFVIADERDSRLILVTLDHDAKFLDVMNSPKIRLGINQRGNKNFEGVSWDDRQKKLIVVKERDPKYVISVKGLVGEPEKGNLDLEIDRLYQYDQMLAWSMRDLSSVDYLGKSGHMLLLSEESKLLKEFDENAKPQGAMLLWRGFHGLKKSVPQAEGITLDQQDNMYLISEPNLFYVFKPGKVTESAI